MTEHPNVELARRGYEAFAKGDLATLTELLADDVVWHVQGGGPLSVRCLASSMRSDGRPRRLVGPRPPA